MFLDESGDHSIKAIDPNYPIFVLGGVIVDGDYAERELTDALRTFKIETLGSVDIVLHTADIVRNKNGFEGMQDADFSARFYADLNSLMLELEYSVVACVISKHDHYRHYGPYGFDPYHLSLNVLLEAFVDEVGNPGISGTIVAEKRGDILDADLWRAWKNLLNRGTPYVKPKVLRRTIQGLTLKSKNENVPGLQLADLVVSPIGRHFLGKPDQADWKIVEQKLRRHPNGDALGHGLFIWPKK